MAKRKRSRTALVIGIFSLLAVGSWISFDVYRGLTQTTITRVLQKQTDPLKVEIEAQELSGLRQRIKFEENLLETIQSVPALTKEVKAPVATPAGELVSQPTTISGQIWLYWN